jgi:AbrB family looped-hinge helix DNA binding protein
MIGKALESRYPLIWQKIWYYYSMKTTIDKAGRVIIPARFRERVGLKPGTVLDVFADDISIRLVPSAPELKLVRRKGRLIAKPTAKQNDLPEVDLAAMVEEERNRWPW